MKKVLIIIFLFIFFNLSAQNSNTDKIIGKWKLIKIIENGKETTINCIDKSTFRFFSGTKKRSNRLDLYGSRKESFGNGKKIKCIESYKTNTLWKNNGDSTYFVRSAKFKIILEENNTFYFILKNYKTEDKTKYVYKKVSD